MPQQAFTNARQPWWVEYNGETVSFLPLTRDAVAILDAEDWPRIRQQYGGGWFCNDNGKGQLYARREHLDPEGQKKKITLQRAIMNPKPEERIRAINGDSLDCRRTNLRVMTKDEEEHLRRSHAQ